MQLLRAILLSGLFVCAATTRAAGLSFVYKSDVKAGRQADDVYLLPTSQALHPWGDQILVRGRPVDLAIDSAHKRLAVLNSTNVLLLETGTAKVSGRIPLKAGSYTGVAFCRGGRELWASEATRKGPDAIMVAELSEAGTVTRSNRITFTGHPVPAGIAISADGATAYVALSRNNSVAVFDVAARTMRKEIPVGMAPFAVVVAERAGRVFVSNRAGRRPTAGDSVAPSSGSDVVADPVTGATEGGTVTVIDLKTYSAWQVKVGRAPSKMALSPDGKVVAVANGHSDSITLIDTASLATTDFKVPTWPAETLGSQPVDACFSGDGKRLYVACAGNNAIAVATLADKKWVFGGAVPILDGSIPAGWFPSALELDGSKLWTVNVKGVGNTSNRKGGFNSQQYEGSIVRLPEPAAGDIEAGTREVQAANTAQFERAGGVKNLRALGIDHVFLIIKENRTYDQVFGDLAQGNGASNLVMYGREVTPNHHALAEQYVLLDNFYASGAISFDGHQWLMQAFVSDYVERSFTGAPRGYAWNLCDALTISPTGFFWQGGRPLALRIFGEFSTPAELDLGTQVVRDIDEEKSPWSRYWNLYKSGRWPEVVRSRCGVPAVAKYVCDRYPVGLNVTDQIRTEVFLQEFRGWQRIAQAPNLVVMCLTSDHTMGTKPNCPIPKAMVADNDLALGRVVEAISHSAFWPRSLILVVEDDAQNGVDHVDGHRTVALAIGPHIRRGVVDSNNYTQLSMIRTIQEIFDLPARTRYLKNARSMNTVFTNQPDLSPYSHLPSNLPLDKMNPPLKDVKGKTAWAARTSMAMNWRDIDDVPQDTLNQILWWDSKGYDTPYPSRRDSPRRARF